MNNKEFREWLSQFPDEMEIEVAVQSDGGEYQSYGPVRFESFNPKEEYRHWYLSDLRENEQVLPGLRKLTMELGSEE